jgi:hypothetical protein
MTVFEKTTNSILAGYMTRRELASQLGVTIRTLQGWEKLRTGPPVSKVSTHTHYRREAVEAWLASLEIPMVREPSRKRRPRVSAVMQAVA